jgi:membrane fusion protein (multidrug efflux system)
MTSRSFGSLFATPGGRYAGVLLVALVLLPPVAGCGKKGPAGGGFTMPPMPVETAPVVRQPVAERFEAVGSIDAGDAITVVAEIAATVESLPFREGSQIAQGSLIAQLEDDQYAAERDRTEALRAQAQTTYDRIKEVVAQGAGSPQDLDDADAALKVAEANLALAQARLAKTRITAPFSGIVGARRVSPGAYVTPGQAITELARIQELRVNFFAPERYLSRLVRGTPVKVSVTAYPGYALEGKVDVVDPVLDPATRNAHLVARVENPEGKFRPGMSANVTATLSLREDALTVPSEAVFVDGNQPFVFAVKPDTTVTRIALVLGTRLPDAVEVLDGLKEGQLVVTAGHQKLFEGARIIPLPAGAGAAGGPGGPGGAAMPGAGGGAPDSSTAAPAAADSAKGDTP